MAEEDDCVRPIRAVVGQVRGRLAGLLAAVVLAAVAVVLTPALVAVAVDAVLRGSRDTGPVVVLAAVLLGTGICEVAVTLLAAAGTANGTAWLRVRGTRHLLALGPGGHFGPGDAVTRIVYSTAEAAHAPVTAVHSTVAIGTAVVGLVLLWVIDWPIGLAFTLSVPLAIVIAHRFLGEVTSMQAGYLDAQSRIAGRLVTALTGIRTIRAAGTAAQEAVRVLVPLSDLSASGRGLWAAQRRTVWRLTLLIALAEVLVLAVAGWGVGAGRISPGELLAVVGYIGLAMSGFDQIDTVLGLGHARAGAARIAEAFAVAAPVQGGRPLPPGPGALTLRGVSVTRGGHRVLDAVDLDVPAGVSLAVVGRSGAGKSALAALIGRLTDPDPGSGEVALDGVPVHEVPLAQLRRAVAYAFDTPVLIGATVADAIGYGAPDPAGADVAAAARAAAADGFIRRLPDGYATALADAPMSGGELQRIGLARAFVRDARVYVLDDATSGLDAATEAQVGRTLTGALGGRTRLVVAHRAATAAGCDLVAWLDGGRLRACAPHAELWADPLYRAVFGTPDAAPTAEESACVPA